MGLAARLRRRRNATVLFMVVLMVLAAPAYPKRVSKGKKARRSGTPAVSRDPMAGLMAAHQKITTGEVDAGLADMRALFNRHPDNVQVAVNYGQLSAHYEQLDEAIRALTGAVEAQAVAGTGLAAVGF